MQCGLHTIALRSNPLINLLVAIIINAILIVAGVRFSISLITMLIVFYGRQFTECLSVVTRGNFGHAITL